MPQPSANPISRSYEGRRGGEKGEREWRRLSRTTVGARAASPPAPPQCPSPEERGRTSEFFHLVKSFSELCHLFRRRSDGPSERTRFGSWPLQEFKLGTSAIVPTRNPRKKNQIPHAMQSLRNSGSARLNLNNETRSGYKDLKFWFCRAQQGLNYSSNAEK